MIEFRGEKHLSQKKDRFFAAHKPAEAGITSYIYLSFTKRYTKRQLSALTISLKCTRRRLRLFKVGSQTLSAL